MKTRVITIIAVLLSLTAGQAADRLQIEDVTLKPGEEKAFKLSLSLDKEKYAGVQFDIQLPTGFSIGMNGNSVYYAFSEKQAADLSCQVSNTGERIYRFMVYSNSLRVTGWPLMHITMGSSCAAAVIAIAARAKLMIIFFIIF